MNYIQLSIIIPVFKVKDYVRKCLESVLAISNLNYEIIVVQDVHADNSLEDVPDLLNNPLIRICNQKNAGLSAARNAGLFLAKGEFVYFMDSDNYIDPIAFSNFFVRAAMYQAQREMENYERRKGLSVAIFVFANGLVEYL